MTQFLRWGLALSVAMIVTIAKPVLSEDVTPTPENTTTFSINAVKSISIASEAIKKNNVTIDDYDRVWLTSLEEIFVVSFSQDFGNNFKEVPSYSVRIDKKSLRVIAIYRGM